MEKTGSINERIADNAILIIKGRKLLYTTGKEAQGHILFEAGVSGALQAFKEVQSTKDPKAIVQAELVFVKEELQHTDKSDKITLNSLNTALLYFGQGMLALKMLESAKSYREAETIVPLAEEFRVQSLPKDAFHVACNSHRARLQNNLRTPGMNMDEKALYTQRAANMNTAKAAYLDLQKEAMGLPKDAPTKGKDKDREI